MTGAELKRLDSNLKDGDKLYADIDGLPDELIHDSQRIILQKHDRFITVPCGNVGFNSVIDAQLTEVKAIYPDAYLQTQCNTYLVVPKFKLPSGWSTDEVTLLFIVPNGFPMSAPDMFFVLPSLRLADGREPNAAQVYEQHLGQQWQRFSWHYTNAASWQPSVSSLLSHLG